MIHFVVALPCEARPLIDRFRLQGRQASGFRLYEGEKARLIVSGVGKTAGAAATAYLQASSGGNGQHAWLNVGVAGHATRAIGEGLVAHGITDAASGKRWYPPLVIPPPSQTDELVTVDRPSADYGPRNALYDMEAAGFYATATRFTTAELVHCYKVVSDNREAPATEVSAKHVTRLMESHVETLADYATQLAGLGEEVVRLEQPPDEYEAFLTRWRFTAYERNQLRRLLQRWQARAPGQPAWGPVLAELGKAKDVLCHLRQTLDKRPLKLTP